MAASVRAAQAWRRTIAHPDCPIGRPLGGRSVPVRSRRASCCPEAGRRSARHLGGTADDAAGRGTRLRSLPDGAPRGRDRDDRPALPGRARRASSGPPGIGVVEAVEPGGHRLAWSWRTRSTTRRRARSGRYGDGAGATCLLVTGGRRGPARGRRGRRERRAAPERGDRRHHSLPRSGPRPPARARSRRTSWAGSPPGRPAPAPGAPPARPDLRRPDGARGGRPPAARRRPRHGRGGARLFYSERTVKNIIHDVTSRLELRNRTHAVAYAIRQGLI